MINWHTFKQGIFWGAFRFSAASAWANVRAAKIKLAVLLPSGDDADDWLVMHQAAGHALLPSVRIHDLSLLMESLRPHWTILSQSIYAVGPGNYTSAFLEYNIFGPQLQSVVRNGALAKCWP